MNKTALEFRIFQAAFGIKTANFLESFLPVRDPSNACNAGFASESVLSNLRRQPPARMSLNG
jgi:hypothetical protein